MRERRVDQILSPSRFLYGASFVNNVVSEIERQRPNHANGQDHMASQTFLEAAQRLSRDRPGQHVVMVRSPVIEGAQLRLSLGNRLTTIRSRPAGESTNRAIGFHFGRS